jgi:hypothetical protein
MMSKRAISFIRLGAILGNLLFMLWVSFNAINEGFSGTLPEKVSYIALMALLTTNILLLINAARSNLE